jgi:hypothetical protein
MADTTPTLAVGMRVLYVPCNSHHMDKGSDGTHCFHFVHVASEQWGDRFAGQPARMNNIGEPWKRETDGSILTLGGHRVKHAGPKFFWPATIAEVPPVCCVAELTPGKDTVSLHYPAHQFHAGMTVRFISLPGQTAKIAAVTTGHEIQLDAPIQLPEGASSLHYLEISGGGLYLHIEHPSGRHSLGYRIDNGAYPVRYDPLKRPHTFHLPEGGASGN